MAFDYNQYRNQNVCMRCRTERDARTFLGYLDSVGLRWYGGDRYTAYTNFADYKEETVYYFLEGLYGSLEDAIEDKATILEFGNYDFTNDYIEQDDIELDVSAFLSEVFE